MKALDLGPGHEVIAIASGGCNVLSYLTADPAGVTAVDLNGAQSRSAGSRSARLRTCRITRVSSASLAAPMRAPMSPPTTAAARKARPRRARLLGQADCVRTSPHPPFHSQFLSPWRAGRFLGEAMRSRALHGLDPSIILKARTLDEQRSLYQTRLAPIFDKPLVRWMMKQPAPLYGLGIPPAQYRALAAEFAARNRRGLERTARAAGMRLRYIRQLFRLAGVRPALRAGAEPRAPALFAAAEFEAVRSRRAACATSAVVDRHSARRAAASFDRYALLDAQDWMNDAELTALWTEISRTARPGARVIFRTAAAERLLPGRVPDGVLHAWRYEEELSAELSR